ncbi:thioredoxin family protein [Fundidesulfovibrio butyratiphilus]
MEIKVLGPGCAKCHETEKLVREVLAEGSIKADVVKVSDLQEIAMMGVFATPAVAVDGKVKCVGKVPSKADIASWLK